MSPWSGRGQGRRRGAAAAAGAAVRGGPVPGNRGGSAAGAATHARGGSGRLYMRPRHHRGWQGPGGASRELLLQPVAVSHLRPLGALGGRAVCGGTVDLHSCSVRRLGTGGCSATGSDQIAWRGAPGAARGPAEGCGGIAGLGQSSTGGGGRQRWPQKADAASGGTRGGRPAALAARADRLPAHRQCPRRHAPYTVVSSRSRRPSPARRDRPGGWAACELFVVQGRTHSKRARVCGSRVRWAGPPPPAVQRRHAQRRAGWGRGHSSNAAGAVGPREAPWQARRQCWVPSARCRGKESKFMEGADPGVTRGKRASQ